MTWVGNVLSVQRRPAGLFSNNAAAQADKPLTVSSTSAWVCAAGRRALLHSQRQEIDPGLYQVLPQSAVEFKIMTARKIMPISRGVIHKIHAERGTYTGPNS